MLTQCSLTAASSESIQNANISLYAPTYSYTYYCLHYIIYIYIYAKLYIKHKRLPFLYTYSIYNL